MKIAVLYTGGTIGSESDGSYVNVHSDTAGLLVKNYYSKHPNSSVSFIEKVILNILSENAVSDDWLTIAGEIKQISRECDGIIVTHGTDTLAYCAAFLSIVFSDIQIPVFLVSSDLPLENPKSNGFENFNTAVMFAVNKKAKGVFIPIYEKGSNYLHLGARLTAARAYTHRFESVGGIYYGTLNNQKFQWNNSAGNPRPEMLENISKQQQGFTVDKLGEIVCIHPYPGLNYDLIDLKCKPDAFLHKTYHSGTACVDSKDEKYSITKFAERCRDAGIDIYAAPFDSHLDPYISTKKMLDSGIRLIENMAFEAAYVKLKIAYGIYSDHKDIIDFANRNIAFEKLA